MKDGPVRRMTAADIPRILEIERACFPNPWTESMFLNQLALDKVSVNLVYDEDGDIMGYVTAWRGYEEVHILSIGIDPPHRGRGAAEALLGEVVGECAPRGCLRVILEVRRSNSRARRFYEKQGFRQIGVRRGYYAETGEDALVLEKEIGGRDGC